MNHEKRILERVFTEEINFSVQALEKDEENRLYIGTVNGLYIYDGKKSSDTLLSMRKTFFLIIIVSWILQYTIIVLFGC